MATTTTDQPRWKIALHWIPFVPLLIPLAILFLLLGAMLAVLAVGVAVLPAYLFATNEWGLAECLMAYGLASVAVFMCRYG